jgi:hypothetical protein
MGTGTTKGRNGIQYQAGMGVGSKSRPSRQKYPRGDLLRAIVINTYGMDDEDFNPRGIHVLCDVILLKSMIPLPRVPVSARIGVSNGETWVPKPTTATLSGEPFVQPQIFNKQGILQGDPTPFDDMNGDVVLVEFIDTAFPVITGPWAHEASNRKVIDGSGWDDSTVDEQRGTPELRERYLRWGGVEVRINENGNVLLDTTGATTDEVEEVPSADGGDVQLRLKQGRTVTVKSGVPPFEQILQLSQDPATQLPVVKLGDGTEPIILGATYTQPELTMLDALITWITVAAPAIGTIVPPPALPAETTKLLAALAAFKAAIPNALSKVSSTE